jgi:hypothetical protein
MISGYLSLSSALPTTVLLFALGMRGTSAPISLPLNCPAGWQAISLVRGHMTARGLFGRRGTRWESPAGYLDTAEAARAVGMRTSSRGSLKSNMRGYLSSSVYEHVQRHAPAPAPTSLVRRCLAGGGRVFFFWFCATDLRV